MELTIDYCTECGYLKRAVEATEEVLEEYPQNFDSVELVPSDGGVFRVSIDSEIVFDQEEDDFSREKVRENVERYIEEQEE